MDEVVVKEDNLPDDKFASQVTGFASETFEKTKGDFEFKEWLQQKIKEEYDAGNIKASQLMALYSNEYINETDRIQKTMSPLSNVLVAKVQAEQKQAAQTAVQINVGNQKTENDLQQANLNSEAKHLQGLVDFQRLLDTLTTNQPPKQQVLVPQQEQPQQ